MTNKLSRYALAFSILGGAAIATSSPALAQTTTVNFSNNGGTIGTATFNSTAGATPTFNFPNPITVITPAGTANLASFAPTAGQTTFNNGFTNVQTGDGFSSVGTSTGSAGLNTGNPNDGQNAVFTAQPTTLNGKVVTTTANNLVTTNSTITANITALSITVPKTNLTGANLNNPVGAGDVFVPFKGGTFDITTNPTTSSFTSKSLTILTPIGTIDPLTFVPKSYVNFDRSGSIAALDNLQLTGETSGKFKFNDSRTADLTNFATTIRGTVTTASTAATPTSSQNVQGVITGGGLTIPASSIKGTANTSGTGSEIVIINIFTFLPPGLLKAKPELLAFYLNNPGSVTYTFTSSDDVVTFNNVYFLNRGQLKKLLRTGDLGTGGETVKFVILPSSLLKLKPGTVVVVERPSSTLTSRVFYTMSNKSHDDD
ncbi:hypothetical protein V2H45_19865 [Tumidithrix elongata RA019]|uniref:Uncharacterized protein n=1 Tax=Tumidithrix elongata BACA0141 TaxID=2716417 RepID=A0AAW9Q6B0_9CYAN|nr:hypothetical protein [Tumidithrix elongata RA019]